MRKAGWEEPPAINPSYQSPACSAMASGTSYHDYCVHGLLMRRTRIASGRRNDDKRDARVTKVQAPTRDPRGFQARPEACRSPSPIQSSGPTWTSIVRSAPAKRRPGPIGSDEDFTDNP
ncbi:uncharacterized protein CLUP02_10621 [Colletotrichum lupini]|uniref:Uncharacterized protein n=1 Tax=Colletotrichum lupini TaxID=145971 RepID=A0A9Q8SX94_9PEZI|nr:uncharacterized protein CLUP02_10621 [Colletotrichum lupini]UQC85125.1 hypothetical protein CLUP02_10621 [Colletotrichum lupini]